jgi:hypothetical protein
MCQKAAKKYIYDTIQVGGILGLFKHSLVNVTFINYLRGAWHFYDGTKSTLDSSATGAPGTNPPMTVARRWFYSGSTTTAITVTPSYPLQTFWQPADATKSANGVGIDPTTNGMNLLNESTLFHEALHGFTAADDQYIQQAFHQVDSTVKVGAPSENISAYIRKWVMSACPIWRR